MNMQETIKTMENKLSGWKGMHPIFTGLENAPRESVPVRYRKVTR